MIRSEWLYYFTEVALSNSYRIASENLHITQPALSIAIKKMEDELGVVLFNRNNQGIAGLTAMGQEVLELSQHILDHLSEMQQIGQKAMEKNGGIKEYGEHINIYTFPAISSGIFKYIFSELKSLKDIKNLSIKDVNYEEMLNSVAEDKYSFALAWNLADENKDNLEQRGIVVHRLYRAKGVVILAKDSQLIPAEQGKCTLQEVYNLPFVSYEKGYGIDRMLYDLLLSKYGKPQVFFEVSNSELFLQILQSGQAVGLGVNVNSWNLSSDNYYKKLRLVPLKENVLFDFNVIYNRECSENLSKQIIAILEKVCIR